jgi:DNA-binding response OmpR family regulator
MVALRLPEVANSSRGFVLLVDDDQRFRAVLRESLRLGGVEHEVVEASSFQSASGALKDPLLRCIVLDLHLSDGQGQELLARVRAAAPTTPVFALSALPPWEFHVTEMDGDTVVSLTKLQAVFEEGLAARVRSLLGVTDVERLSPM